MINPFVDFTNINDTDLEKKLNDLTKKYFMTNNADLKYQISIVISMYREELANRRNKIYNEQFDKQEGLDNLIKVN
ncbi:MAG: hypothetical protein EBT86_05125 [Actinobacteria bacterium]|nr:hypothetical protein [Actinomycetota bacterium]